MRTTEFVLPPPRPAAWRGTARVFTHKGEYLQGPVGVTIDGHERYTIGVFSLLDDLNSAYVDVRRTPWAGGPQDKPPLPEVRVHPNGWNEGEQQLVVAAVRTTWQELGAGEPCGYDVYGYHDIRVGAGSGSSSALVQATIRATASEHDAELGGDLLAALHSRVESGSDPIHTDRPEIWATRLQLGRPVRQLGERNPSFVAVTWTPGGAVRTTGVRFAYTDEELLLWRVRWASLERAVKSADDARVARLATESARDNQSRNPNANLAQLEAAIEQFGALGFSVAHTGTYHTALFADFIDRDTTERYRQMVASTTGVPLNEIDVFETGQSARRRYST